MPSSYVTSVPGVVQMIIDADPARVLDVGPGWGKYGVMCREYLPRLAALDAVEVREGRLRLQNAIYDDVYTIDARDFQNWERYDLVLLIDVIEHLSMEDGHALLQRIQAAGAQVIVSTPKVFIEQHDDRNPYEHHLSLWTGADFNEHGIKRDESTIDSIIYLLKGVRHR